MLIKTGTVENVTNIGTASDLVNSPFVTGFGMKFSGGKNQLKIL